jgi:hypothetical protein
VVFAQVDDGAVSGLVRHHHVAERVEHAGVEQRDQHVEHAGDPAFAHAPKGRPVSDQQHEGGSDPQAVAPGQAQALAAAVQRDHAAEQLGERQRRDDRHQAEHELEAAHGLRPMRQKGDVSSLLNPGRLGCAGATFG